MAILELPVRSDLAAYSFLIELEGAKYTLRFRYNTRGAYWSMDIATSEDIDVVNGIPIQVNVDLTSRFDRSDLPPGAILAYDESGNAAEPTRDNFGQTVKLLYQEANA